jgi:hypothetical protein
VERVERKLAAILAADVAGYSRLMGVDEAGTLAQLKAHQDSGVTTRTTPSRIMPARCRPCPEQLLELKDLMADSRPSKVEFPRCRPETM